MVALTRFEWVRSQFSDRGVTPSLKLLFLGPLFAASFRFILSRDRQSVLGAFTEVR
ncbi:MAG: hypothetical protein JWO80_5990 [Bryobacterales bacterium]|nr:hypothetical protein [Bryobacterales bacterium]